MMDTKEALKELEDLTVDYGNRNEEQIARLDEAIDMAMEALRNLPNRLRQAMDTISRKATIDAMENVDWYHISKDGRLVHGANSDDHEPLYKAKDVYTVLNTMPSAQPETHDKRTETHACDCISRQAAIDIERNATVDTNPSHFVAHQKFTQFLDDAEISSFGRWQWSNGFNTALTAVGIDLKKLPPAQPEIVQCEDCQHWEQETINDGYCIEMDLRMCDADFYCGYAERRTDGN